MHNKLTSTFQEFNFQIPSFFFFLKRSVFKVSNIFIYIYIFLLGELSGGSKGPSIGHIKYRILRGMGVSGLSGWRVAWVEWVVAGAAHLIARSQS